MEVDKVDISQRKEKKRVNEESTGTIPKKQAMKSDTTKTIMIEVDSV